jgi:hypothetical protein
MHAFAAYRPAPPACLPARVCSNVANTAITTATPPKTAAQLQKEQLAAAAKNLKSQILRQGSAGSSSNGGGGGGGGGNGGSSVGNGAASKLASAASGRLSAAGSANSGKKEVKTLDECLAGEWGAWCRRSNRCCIVPLQQEHALRCIAALLPEVLC